MGSIMNIMNGWTTAKAVNGDIIRVNIVPLKKVQSNLHGQKIGRAHV